MEKLVVFNMFSAIGQDIGLRAKESVGGAKLTIQDFPTRIVDLLSQFSVDELVKRSRPLAYHSDVIGDVFYDEIPENLRKPFEKALNEQRAANAKVLEQQEYIKKLQDHINAKKAGAVSPHEEFFKDLFSAPIKEPEKTEHTS